MILSLESLVCFEEDSRNTWMRTLEDRTRHFQTYTDGIDCNKLDVIARYQVINGVPIEVSSIVSEA